MAEARKARRVTKYIKGLEKSEKLIVIKHYLIKYIPNDYDDKRLVYVLEHAEVLAGVLAKRRKMNVQVLINGAHSFVEGFPNS